ncbi:MAG: DUF998 domain-containing protein [Bacillota bacterium]
MKDTESGDRSAAGTRLLLTCGVIAGPLFTIVWFIAGAARAHYDPMRHPISSLAIGDFGWTQAGNFIVTGLLTLAFAVGLHRALRPGSTRWGALLIGACAIGLLGAGAFVADPRSGYPPGTPATPQAYSTVPGTLHDLFSSLVFFGLPIACFVFARLFSRWGERSWSRYSVGTGVTFLLMFILTSVGFAQVEGLVDVAGLLQRITLTVGWAWLTALAIRMLRVTS